MLNRRNIRIPLEPSVHRNPYRPRRELATHTVTNQAPPLVDYNAFTTDTALNAALEREGGDWGRDRAVAYGDIAGGELMELGFQANENPPTLHLFDRYGARIDEVEFHPAYHRIMQRAKEHGLHSLTWTADRPGAQVVRSALYYLHNQFEAGTACPITMTHAAAPVFARFPDPGRRWLDRVLADAYDDRVIPPADKHGLTVGMGMTEKQGGSDVRTNTTEATATDRDGVFTLRGHKWFFSAPMCDLFLVLAQDDGGLSCFVLPRWTEAGERNAIDIQRLKNKLGDRSNASSEVEFRDTEAYRIGETGRGVATIIEMVSQTRLDCMLGSAGLMRQATVQAIHHARHREAFGQRLADAPLMQEVLADLALESEAAMAYAMRLARAFEGATAHETHLARLATPVGKYLICKAAPAAVNEAQECLGGGGYVEESILPRLYRQAPLNSIWEGSGNVQCLDLLRALAKSPDSIAALEAELAQAGGRHPAFDIHCEALGTRLKEKTIDPAGARALAGDIARGLQAAILLTGDAPWVGEAFCAARLAPRRPGAYGTAGLGDMAPALVERAAI
ncbi:acyl-CoA dehydrogenase family protein [Salinisphaera hydrothermalis]|uniref:Acyl-CoA dehydrogenase n=1 Tax=Salinisphaera hydrothermalis (strain C41B8) TaxID=1304275 RepID=A0A084IKF8_SALHC|nr:acyl-CoA dehydrogenase family protein [Salinisphaera hydrothermalis]KEZ77192.1 acyl-CoA dehydrogenase [Salinisphaera hydrothermalis C41B8]